MTDALIHAVIAAALTVALGFLGSPWLAALVVSALFYGREQAQQQYREDPPEGWRKFIPIGWGDHGQREFWAPAVVSLGVACVMAAL